MRLSILFVRSTARTADRCALTADNTAERAYARAQGKKVKFCSHTECARCVRAHSTARPLSGLVYKFVQDFP